jgi:hypothetical protein
MFAAQADHSVGESENLPFSSCAWSKLDDLSVVGSMQIAYD